MQWCEAYSRKIGARPKRIGASGRAKVSITLLLPPRSSFLESSCAQVRCDYDCAYVLLPNQSTISTMPRVLNHTPSWLSRPSQGFELFSPSNVREPAVPKAAATSMNRPRQVTACRGTEIFVAVGSELRWSDLVLLKENAPETGLASRSQFDESAPCLYRVSQQSRGY